MTMRYLKKDILQLMHNYNSKSYRPDRGKSISTGQRPVNDGHQTCALKGQQPLLSPFQGLQLTSFFRRALPLFVSNNAINYLFLAP
jgi:hypothetical protein